MEGECVEHHDSLTSTQIRGQELARAGIDKALVIADEQTAGRGRIARRWESAKGNGLYFSILFRPRLPPSVAHLLNAMAALSVAEAVHRLSDIELQLKWPNDLLLPLASPGGGCKVCGILSESSFQGGRLVYCVTGIGINLHKPQNLPAEVLGRIGWLYSDGEEADRAELLSRIVHVFFAWLRTMERDGVENLLATYRKCCASVGRTVRVETEAETLTGLCTGIGDEGQLIIETAAGPRQFHVADITHARLEMGPTG